MWSSEEFPTIKGLKKHFWTTLLWNLENSRLQQRIGWAPKGTSRCYRAAWKFHTKLQLKILSSWISVIMCFLILQLSGLLCFLMFKIYQTKRTLWLLGDSSGNSLLETLVLWCSMLSLYNKRTFDESSLTEVTSFLGFLLTWLQQAAHRLYKVHSFPYDISCILQSCSHFCHYFIRYQAIVINEA